jgi:hypothetical protein
VADFSLSLSSSTVSIAQGATGSGMFPRTKSRFVGLQVEVREEQSVVSDLPKCVLVVARQPDVIWAPLNCFSEDCEGSVILALQYWLKRLNCW